MTLAQERKQTALEALERLILALELWPKFDFDEDIVRLVELQTRLENLEAKP